MKKLVVLTLFLGLVALVQGQKYDRVSGYLGKRLVIGGGIGVSPSFQKQRYDAEDKQITLNKSFMFHAEYAVKPYMSIGLKGESIHTSLDFYSLGWGESISWEDDLGEHELSRFWGAPDIKCKSIGAYLKFFLKSRGAMAPIGKYFSLGLDMKRIAADFSTSYFYTRSVDEFGNKETHKFTLKNPKLIQYSPMFYLALGNVVPLNRTFSLEYQLNSGVLFSGLLPNEKYAYDASAIQQYAFNVMNERMLSVYYVNFVLKLNMFL